MQIRIGQLWGPEGILIKARGCDGFVVENIESIVDVWVLMFWQSSASMSSSSIVDF